MNQLTDKTELKRLRRKNKLLFIQFGAQNCGPCIAIREKIDRWIEAHENTSAIYIPIEKFPEIAAEEGVFTAPTVFVYVDGKLTVRESGYFGLEDIFIKAEKYINLLK